MAADAIDTDQKDSAHKAREFFMISPTYELSAAAESMLEEHPHDLHAKVAFLSRTESYPERPTTVEVIQTHMSFVFLTGQHAYKLKKPVRYEYLDFSTLEARRTDCDEEMRLNRRLARDVYLDVVALTRSPQGELRLGGEGEPVEWLVKMRRLPRELMLDHALREHQLTREDVRRFMHVLIDFYTRAEPAPISAAQYCRRFEHDVITTHRELASPSYGLDRTLQDLVTRGQLAFLERYSSLLGRRAAERRIVEGHGDLRPEHICLGAKPRMIDCLEFNRQWRLVDPSDEIGYFAMECELLGSNWVGEVALETYREHAQDRPPDELVRFYKSCRASLRAKLSAWHLREHLDPAARTKWTDRARRYLDLAARYALPS